MKRFTAFLALAIASTVLAVAGEIDYQKLADRTDFHWRAEESTILYSLSRLKSTLCCQSTFPLPNRGILFLLVCYFTLPISDRKRVPKSSSILSSVFSFYIYQPPF